MPPAQYRDFAPNTRFPSTWADALEILLGSYASRSLTLLQSGTNVVLLPVSTDVGRVELAINGKPRWVTADVSTPVSAGTAAGTLSVWAVTGADVFATTTGTEPYEVDNTDHNFSLRVLAAGATPSGTGTETHYRKIGEAIWDGSQLRNVYTTLFLDRRLGGAIPVGGYYWGVQTDDFVTPEGAVFVQGDGRLIDLTTYSIFYLAQGGAAHRYNGGVNPGSNKVRIPDLRGRVMVGPDTMGGVRIVDPVTGVAFANPGAANRIPSSNRAAGQNGGEERHQLLAAESGVNGSGSTTTSGDHYHQFQGEQFAPGGGTLGPYFRTNAGLDSTFATTLPKTYVNPEHSHPLVGRNADSSHNNMQPYEIDPVFVRIA